MKSIFTRCGYRCDLCLAYKPNVEKNPSNQQKLSDGWFKYFGFRLPPESILCDGCMADHPKLIDSACPVRPCVIARGLDNCCGLYGIPLRAFASVGMAGDERLKGGWDWLLHCQRSDGGWLRPNHITGSPHPSRTQGRYGWDRSCAWGSTFAAQALFYARRPEYQPVLSCALVFLLWHLAQKDETHIQTWVYHGHNIVKELLMFSEAGVNMRLRPIPALLSWLMGYYRPSEGVFRTQEKPIPVFTRHISAIMKNYQASYGPTYWETIPKVSAGILRYQLYHLVEDDWLTYYLTRIAQNMLI